MAGACFRPPPADDRPRATRPGRPPSIEYAVQRPPISDSPVDTAPRASNCSPGASSVRRSAGISRARSLGRRLRATTSSSTVARGRSPRRRRRSVHALDVKNTWTMNVEFYTGVEERLDVPHDPPPRSGARRSSESARMLIADDVRRHRRDARAREGTSAPARSPRCAAPSLVREVALDRQSASTSGGARISGIDFPWSAERPSSPRTCRGLATCATPVVFYRGAKRREEDHVADRLAARRAA